MRFFPVSVSHLLLLRTLFTLVSYFRQCYKYQAICYLLDVFVCFIIFSTYKVLNLNCYSIQLYESRKWLKGKGISVILCHFITPKPNPLWLFMLPPWTSLTSYYYQRKYDLPFHTPKIVTLLVQGQRISLSLSPAWQRKRHAMLTWIPRVVEEIKIEEQYQATSGGGGWVSQAEGTSDLG